MVLNGFENYCQTQFDIYVSLNDYICEGDMNDEKLLNCFNEALLILIFSNSISMQETSRTILV